ncbi:MSMEG_0570 family nitrogen starvation response protein [Acidisoma cellulosilytica]|uniref:MSMEG_0570 family nitrogen starvation response protein n=1 Tax=Acidisoma cellulosilyticum TaxID=2802395 RepID=A0A963YZ88_9PROT|nr:MSMEG_0570 family nitrogen starvation response protein [Acidisoma cellulosilyticum]MCB8879790.1 MSMEG_0570 family nitrogen starvation response protein [Acidisoma cellulosilyticum]
MPEMEFSLRWPDGSESRCYSPSLVVEDHLTVGETYPVPDLVARSRAAMTEASRRVAVKFGFPCSRAMATLSTIEQRAAQWQAEPAAAVTVLSFHRLT